MSQNIIEIAEGITEVSTASHGGILISDKRREVFDKCFPAFTPFAGGNWFEEDEDWAFPVAVFPELFSEFRVYYAVKSITTAHDKEKTEHEEDLRENCENAVEIHDAFKKEHADEWETGSMGSHPEGWHVWLTRIGDGKGQHKVFDGYPDKSLYTDEELNQLGDLHDKNRTESIMNTYRIENMISGVLLGTYSGGSEQEA
jgi:hypothetical protein